MKWLTVSGHRNLGGREGIAAELLISAFYRAKEAYGEIGAVTGGASGADFLAAEAAIIADIEHILMPPHMGYFEHYGVDEEAQKGPKTVLKPVYEGGSFHWKMNNDRNDAMLDAADILLVVSHRDVNTLLSQKKGGTAHCIQAAYRHPKFKSVVHLDTLNAEIRRYNFK